MPLLKLFQGLMLTFWAQMAVSGDMALILGEVGQVAAHRNDTTVISSDFAGPLREAGFDIVQPKNRSSGSMRLAAQQIEAALAEGGLDRLVVVVTGPLASSGRETWALSNGATGASTLNVGVTGISVGALTDMAAAARGRSVILIAPGRKMNTLGNGLKPGLIDLQASSEVTYVIGPAEALAELLRDELLDPAKSLAEALNKQPANLQIMGFVSDQVGLMGDASTE